MAGHAGEVTVSYTLCGDRADGTDTDIDRTHAHLNMPATFMWARGLDDRDIELTVRIPEGSGWRVATQLAPTGDPLEYAEAVRAIVDASTGIYGGLRDFDFGTYTFLAVALPAAPPQPGGS